MKLTFLLLIAPALASLRPPIGNYEDAQVALFDYAEALSFSTLTSLLASASFLFHFILNGGADFLGFIRLVVGLYSCSLPFLYKCVQVLDLSTAPQRRLFFATIIEVIIACVHLAFVDVPWGLTSCNLALPNEAENRIKNLFIQRMLPMRP